MTTFPGSPRLVKGGLVLLDPVSSAVQRVIAFQYNPDTLTRSFQIRGTGEGGDRSDALRLKGPPVETIKVEVELDGTDQLEVGDATAVEVGVQAQLAALETMAYPTSRHLLENNRLAQSGKLEIAPMQSSLALFVWSKNRIIPVRLTELSVTEEAFDPELNPIRAKVSLGLRVLSVDDLGFDHRGGSLYLVYQQTKEKLAGRAPGSTLGALGIGGLP